MIVIAGPGQGAQTPGMFASVASDADARARLEELSEAAELDLLKLGTDADADEVRRTEVAQPLIVAAGILSLDTLRRGLDLAVRTDVAYAGHSVGEITAAYGAGVFDAITAMRFVSARARAMQQDAERVTTSMSAVLGGDEHDVLARLGELGLEPANFNGAGQIVAAGEPEALAALSDEPPAKARVMPLQVAGAFHTRFMSDARERLRAIADGFPVSAPIAPLYSNVDGAIVRDATEVRARLIEQVASPVRWDLEMAALVEDGITGLIELAPAGPLAGLAKRGMRGVPVAKITDPLDVDEARALLS